MPRWVELWIGAGLLFLVGAALLVFALDGGGDWRTWLAGSGFVGASVVVWFRARRAKFADDPP